MSDSQRIENEHYLYLINNLSVLLTKEVYLGEDLNITHNRYGLSEYDQNIIKEKIMQSIDKIKI